MGVRFNQSTKYIVKKAQKKIHISELNGKVVAIDAFYYMKFFDDGNDMSVWHAMLSFVLHLAENKIIPIFVFDGDNSNKAYKEETLKSRRVDRYYKYLIRDHIKSINEYLLGDKSVAADLLKEIDNLESIENQCLLSHLKILKNHITNNIYLNPGTKKYFSNLNSYLQKNIRDYTSSCDSNFCALFCYVMGVPFIKASGDGEQLCVSLVRTGIADIIISPDSDVILMGLDVYSFDPDMGIKPNYFSVIKIDDVMKGVGMDEDSFLTYLILQGCDLIPRSLPKIKYHDYINDPEGCINSCGDQVDRFKTVRNFYSRFYKINKDNIHDLIAEFETTKTCTFHESLDDMINYLKNASIDIMIDAVKHFEYNPVIDFMYSKQKNPYDKFFTNAKIIQWEDVIKSYYKCLVADEHKLLVRPFRKRSTINMFDVHLSILYDDVLKNERVNFNVIDNNIISENTVLLPKKMK